jgi:hypothetical protein
MCRGADGEIEEQLSAETKFLKTKNEYSIITIKLQKTKQWK